METSTMKSISSKTEGGKKRAGRPRKAMYSNAREWSERSSRCGAVRYKREDERTVVAHCDVTGKGCSFGKCPRVKK